MSVIFILITIITMPNGDTIGYVIPQGVPFIGGLIPITTGGVEIGIVLTLRFMILIFAFQLFLISTQPRDLVHTMEKVGLPIDYILMFIIALRFIPTLQIEGQRIHEAQLARGFNPGTGFVGKIRSVAPIAIPLVSNALLRSNVLGTDHRYAGIPDRKKDACTRAGSCNPGLYRHGGAGSCRVRFCCARAGAAGVRSINQVCFRDIIGKKHKP